MGGSNAKDSDGYPHLTWDYKNPKSGVGLSVISSQPHALWLGNWTGGADDRAASNYVYGALMANQVPVLVLYNLPYRDCGQASTGGASDYGVYASWIGDVASGIADGVNRATSVSKGKVDQTVPIMVMLEPDSIGLIPTDANDPTNGKKCWTNKGGPKGPRVRMFDPVDRFAAISSAVWVLASAAYSAPVCNMRTDSTNTPYRPYECPSFRSRVKVYLDGGNSGWQGGWPDVMAKRMVTAGISAAQGFFTNPSNYQKTSDEIGFGYNLLTNLSGLLADDLYGCDGGTTCAPPMKTQVIDVSRNGKGPGSFSKTADGSPYQPNGWPYWCDNQQARLGQHPTLYADNYVAEVSPKGAVSFVDGLLWLKPPGETDGCWGGPATTPNTQPTLASLLLDTIDASNGKYDLIPSDAAGWPSPYLSCGLATGTFIHPAYSSQSTAICDVSATAKPAAPSNFRITHETRIAKGAAADTVTLEWEPVPGACEYHLAARVNAANSDNESVVRSVVYSNGKPIATTNKNVTYNGFGPPTRYVVNPAVKGSSVVYSIQAVSCDGTKSSSWTVTPKTYTSGWK